MVQPRLTPMLRLKMAAQSAKHTVAVLASMKVSAGAG